MVQKILKRSLQASQCPLFTKKVFFFLQKPLRTQKWAQKWRWGIRVCFKVLKGDGGCKWCPKSKIRGLKIGENLQDHGFRLQLPPCCNHTLIMSWHPSENTFTYLVCLIVTAWLSRREHTLYTIHWSILGYGCYN